MVSSQRFVGLVWSKPCLLVLCLLARWAQGQSETRVDDEDPAIVYSPADSWFRNTEENSMDAGGFHMVTTDAAATATFTFTGTGISYMAPLYGIIISTQVTLDGGVPEIIDLQDHTVIPADDGPSTVESSVLWSVRGLTNTEHELVIGVPPGGAFAVVDMLIVHDESSTSTITETTETTGTSTATTSQSTGSRTRLSSATSPTASPTPETTAGLTIALATVGSVVGLLLIVGILWFWRRRQQQRKEKEIWTQNYQNNQPPPPDMTEIDDGISAPPKHRYKSIPTRKSGYMDEDNMSQQSNVTTPSAHAKQNSKLRQVVATEGSSQPRTR